MTTEVSSELRMLRRQTIETADKALPIGEIDAALYSNTRIHLADEGSWEFDIADAAADNWSSKARNIHDNAAAETDDQSLRSSSRAALAQTLVTFSIFLLASSQSRTKKCPRID